MTSFLSVIFKTHDGISVIKKLQNYISSAQSEQSRPITTDWVICPIRAENAHRKKGFRENLLKRGDAAMYII